METAVLKVVDEICDDDESSGSPRYCTSIDCRTDVACFVLNRIPQRYVSSQRGRIHTDVELTHDPQLLVDIVTLTHEGLHRVTSVRRSFYGDSGPPDRRGPGPRYHVPVILGRLLDGTTFDLVADATVHLLENGEPVRMLDARWQNPYRIVKQTAGNYLFWPASVAVERQGEDRVFEFEIRVSGEGYEQMRHFFSVKVAADQRIADALGSRAEHRLPDLYLVPV